MKHSSKLMICALLLTTILLSCYCCSSAQPQIASRVSGIRTVSLSNLQEQARRSPKGDYARFLSELSGLKRLLGYIVDDDNKDILLYGLVNPQSTNILYTEDFCIALRNAWMKYATRNGSTFTYTDPGCSIDPDPETWRKLNEIGGTVNSDQNSNKVENNLKQWRTICEEWQKVRVLGIPFNSRFAATLVTADYDMKILVDGNDSLDIPGFSSLTGMKLDAVRNAVSTRQPISVPLSAMNRFWFYPGSAKYTIDEGIVMITQCPVILLTEEMAFDRKAGRTPVGRIDHLAQKFCDDFSALYSKVSELRPIYRDLEDLFRLVACVKIIRFCEMPEKIGLNLDPVLKNGLDLSPLLDQYQVTEVSVANQLRGRSAIKEFKYTEDTGGGQSIYQLWLESCGGVGIDIDVKKEHFQAPTPVLRRLKHAILAARPSRTSLFWDVPSDNESVLEIQTAMRLSNENGSNPWRATVLIQRKDSNYQVFTERGSIYNGDTISGLVVALRACGAIDGKHLSIKLSGFIEKELAGFRAALRLQLEKYDQELAITFINENSPELVLFDALVSPGASMDPLPQRANGEFELPTTQTASLLFQVRTGNINHKFQVQVTSEKTEFTAAMIRAIVDRFRTYKATSQSLFDCILSEKAKTLNLLKLKNKNIQIRIKTESGMIETGAILRSTTTEQT